MWALEWVIPWIPDRRHRLTHDVTNVILGGINALVAGVVFASVGFSLMNAAEQNGFGLLHVLNPSPLISTIAAILLLDLWQYVWHRINHAVPLLWRFHAVHHADADMDATTGVRFHPVEILASGVLRLAALPILGIRVGDLILYEAIMLPVVLFHHSNLRFPDWADRWLRTLVVTPAMHRVHHSVHRVEHDSNFASVFSVWDRMFGSFSRAGSDVQLGLTSVHERTWRSFVGMLKQPFSD